MEDLVLSLFFFHLLAVLIVMNVMWDFNGREVVVQQRSVSVQDSNIEVAGVGSTITTDATRGAGGITPPLTLMDQDQNHLTSTLQP